MKKLSFIGVKDEAKKFRLIDSELFHKELDRLPEGRYNIIVEQRKRKASNSQFGWLYAHIYPLILERMLALGIDNCLNVDDVDNYMKILFANKEVANIITGQVEKIPMNKREFATIEMNVFIEQIRQFTLEYLDLEIPEPNVNWKIEFEEI